MIGMQYTIQLPADYDMNIIYDRVQQNGHKTDGYAGLLFKAYLVSVKGAYGQLSNSYCPLYVWNHQDGIHSFLFDGPYDSILQSFGWQHVQIGIPMELPLSQASIPALSESQRDNKGRHLTLTAERLQQARYVIEYIGSIQPARSLQEVPDAIARHLQTQGLEPFASHHQGQLLIYNPDKWAYHQFYFVETVPENVPDCCNVYTILHWSFGAEA